MLKDSGKANYDMDVIERYLYDRDKKADLYRVLYSIICQKDRYTGWHCRSVADMSLLIGKKVGMPEDKLPLLYTSALLHDIGKIMVDNVYLLKPDKLTEAEYLKIKAHPTEGAKILETFAADKQMVDAAWHHHERWDGSGYPDGLEKNGISFMTRIISMADSYDAMANERPYKDPLPPDRIRDEFVKGKGTQFDPVLCDAMIDILDENAQDDMIEYLLAESTR